MKKYTLVNYNDMRSKIVFFIVEPGYDKNGESMLEILLKSIMADVDEKCEGLPLRKIQFKI